MHRFIASEINYLAPREKTRMAQVHLVNPPRKKHDMNAYADAYSERYREKDELRIFDIWHASTVDNDRKGAAHWFMQRIISFVFRTSICLTSPGLSM